MAVSPMRWWSDRALAKVAGRAARAADGWREAWGCTVPASVACEREHEWKDAAPRPSPMLNAAVFDALFGPRPVSATGDDLAADRIAELAMAELRDALRAACFLPAREESDGTPAARAHAWSGAVIVAMLCGSIRIVWRLDATSVAALLAAEGEAPEPARRPEAPVLATLADALHERTVRVRTTLAAGELDLASLQALAVGDVIRLPHLLDRPLAVQADDTPLPFVAYLGQRNGRRAIGLAGDAAHPDSGAAR